MKWWRLPVAVPWDWTVRHMIMCLANGKLLGIGFLAGLALGTVGLSRTYADFNLGAASNYAVLGVGGTSTTGSGSVIIGNVGIGSGGTLTLNGSTVEGSAQFQSPLVTSGAGQNFYQNGAFISGGVSGGVSLVGSAVTAAQSLANFAAGEAATTSISNQTITALAGADGNTVVNLNSLSLFGGSLTINGSANSWFIINIASSLSLVGSSINLVGGVTADQVLFNVEGTGNAVTISGGTYGGTILAMNSGVSFSGGVLTGQILGGTNSQVLLSGTVTVNDAPSSPDVSTAAEPASLILLGIGGIGGAGILGWKRWWWERARGPKQSSVCV